MRERAIFVAATSPTNGRGKILLAEAFLVDTLAAASHSSLRADVHLALDGDPGSLPASLISPLASVFPQTGNSFGERLVSIFERGFESGYRSVCVVNSDTPHLPVAFYTEAFGRLERGIDRTVVIGPADEGGFVLMALRSDSDPARTRQLFENIPWGSTAVLAATREQAVNAELSVTLLPLWYDINRPEDLARLRTDFGRAVVFAPATQQAILETFGV